MILSEEQALDLVESGHAELVDDNHIKMISLGMGPDGQLSGVIEFKPEHKKETAVIEPKQTAVGKGQRGRKIK